MQYRTRACEWQPLPVAFQVNLKQRLEEVARRLLHRAISRAELFAARAHYGQVAQVGGGFAIQMEVASHRLPSARDRRRREFEQEPLRDLFDFALIQPNQHRREREIDRIPRERFAEIALQRRRISHQVKDQNFGALGWSRSGEAARQPDPMAFYEI